MILTCIRPGNDIIFKTLNNNKLVHSFYTFEITDMQSEKKNPLLKHVKSSLKSLTEMPFYSYSHAGTGLTEQRPQSIT